MGPPQLFSDIHFGEVWGWISPWPQHNLSQPWQRTALHGRTAISLLCGYGSTASPEASMCCGGGLGCGLAVPLNCIRNTHLTRSVCQRHIVPTERHHWCGLAHTLSKINGFGGKCIYFRSFVLKNVTTKKGCQKIRLCPKCRLSLKPVRIYQPSLKKMAAKSLYFVPRICNNKLISGFSPINYFPGRVKNLFPSIRAVKSVGFWTKFDVF